MPGLALNLLHLDDALLGQAEFLARCRELGAREHDERPLGEAIRLWATARHLESLRERLEPALAGISGPETIVTFLGSGDFHHVTSILAGLVAGTRGGKVTIVHFDHHPDWVRVKSGVHCGSWVSDMLSRDLVERVVSLGPSSGDLKWPEFKRADLRLLVSGKLAVFPFQSRKTYVRKDYGRGPSHAQEGYRLSWRCIGASPTRAAIDEVVNSIETDAVYVSIDKDVLRSEDAVTNWDQGTLSLAGLGEWVAALIRERQVLGIDIVGDYSPPRYAGPLWSRFAKRGEALIDQPHRAVVDRARSAALNQRSNLALLETLRASLCH